MGLTIVLDTCVLIAFSRQDDPHHRRAMEVLAAPNAEFVVNPVTMAEYLIKPAQLDRDIQADMDRLCRKASIRVVSQAELEAETPWPVTLAGVRAATGLKMPDTIVLATAKLLGATVATFDETLRKAADKQGCLLNWYTTRDLNPEPAD